jgi:hypothetical protein
MKASRGKRKADQSTITLCNARNNVAERAFISRFWNTSQTSDIIHTQVRTKRRRNGQRPAGPASSTQSPIARRWAGSPRRSDQRTSRYTGKQLPLVEEARACRNDFDLDTLRSKRGAQQLNLLHQQPVLAPTVEQTRRRAVLLKLVAKVTLGMAIIAHVPPTGCATRCRVSLAGLRWLVPYAHL